MNDRTGRPSEVRGRPDVTVVVPAHNEEGNVDALLEQFGELVRKARFTVEVVFVDDGSTDRTLPRLVAAQQKHKFFKIVSLPYRRGLTEALRAGFAVARGDILVFYPADRQFHPADIPRMVEKVRAGYDLVTGRKIGQYNKKVVSGFYSWLSRLLFPSIQVTDLNSVKAFRREMTEVFDYRHDWHRYWVAIVSEAGYRVGEVDVTLYPRPSGRSKYGIWRIPGAILDLLAVKFQYHTMRRPLWYFGLTGLVLLAAAFLIGLVALYQRYALGEGNRALVFLVMTLGLSGVFFFAIGFLAESVAGIRQQVESLRAAPKYQVYRPERTTRPVTSRSGRPAASARDSEERGRGDRSRPARPSPSPRTRRSTSESRQTQKTDAADDKPRERKETAASPVAVEQPEPTTVTSDSERGQGALEFPPNQRSESGREETVPPSPERELVQRPEKPVSVTPERAERAERAVSEAVETEPDSRVTEDSQPAGPPPDQYGRRGKR